MPQLILDKSEKWLFMLTLNARSDKYDLNQPLSSQRNQWHVIYPEEFHDLLYQRPFEDQLVSFP